MPDFDSDWSDAMLAGSTSAAEETSSSQFRLLIVAILSMALFLGLFGRLFWMQIVSAEDFSVLANGNRIRTVIDYAPRGKIIDINGVVLADNTVQFQVTATPYLLSEDTEERFSDITRISDLIDMSVQDIQEALFADDVDQLLPVLLSEAITHDAARQLQVQVSDLQGFSIEQIPVRKYKSDHGLAHIVGYSGRVSEADLENDETDALLPTDFIGKAGIEASYDHRLRGTNGWQQYEVDALGQIVRATASQKAIPGEDLQLTLDVELQESLANAILKQMQEAKVDKASGVAINPINGDVLAMVSVPWYDNNLFVGGISQADFDVLNLDANGPLYNKVVAGGYTSGSVIKPLVAAAALQEGVVTDRTIINDNGFIEVFSQFDPSASFRFNGWRLSGLGAMDVRSAIAWSSNIYFYTVGGGHGGIDGLGEERLTSYYREFGLGEASGILLPGEIQGRVPDNAWKLENKGEPWYVGDSYNISIGQGDLLISPLQITFADATIVNDGYLLRPQLVEDEEHVIRRESSIDKQYLQIVREGMRQVLTDGTTCECTFDNVPVTVAGKSGTAETDTPGGKRPHAWYTAFAPYEAPEFMATVMLEEGVGGSQYAAPAIADVMATYFADKATN